MTLRRSLDGRRGIALMQIEHVDLGVIEDVLETWRENA
jgi:hypothetical protein